jgi:Flp pilus assembly protein TadG
MTEQRHGRTACVARGGYALIYAAFVILVLAGICAFAIDLGRVFLTMSELQSTADAAARAAVWRIPSLDIETTSTTGVYAVAKSVASKNKAAATSVVLDEAQGDIEIGYYSTVDKTFTKATTDDELERSNAVRVNTARAASRSNAVTHAFAPAIGSSDSSDVETTAVAMIFGGQTVTGHGAGLFGRRFVKFNGNTTGTDSYDPALGPYGGTNVFDGGGVSTNGYIDLGNGDVHGDARWGAESSSFYPSNTYLTSGPNGSATGWQARNESVITYPSVTAPTSYNNSSIPSTYLDNKKGANPDNFSINGSSSVTFDAGTYYFTNFSVTGNATVTINGAVTIYVKGNLDLTGGSITGNSSLPANLTFNVLPSTSGTSTVDLGGGSALYAHIYAPNSDFIIHGTGSFGLYGWVIGDSIDVKGNSKIHYDGSIYSDGNPNNDEFSVQLVR